MKLALVIPCYNETEVLPETSTRLVAKMQNLINAGRIEAASKIIFVNDGSKDATWELITRLSTEQPLIGGINLAHNAGHQNALLAGLEYSQDKFDASISLDADLQDDVEVINQFVDAYLAGHDVVYGVRKSRTTDSFFKRSTALSFYKMMAALGCDIVYNHADYRLMSKRAIKALSQFSEVNLFLRGLVPMVGFKSTKVFYDRHERFAGESKYPFRKMLAFAINGITSLSIKPIRVITSVGLIIFLLSIVMLAYSLVSYFTHNAILGWSSLIVSVWALGGLQLLAIGIIGEYIGKIYMESKRRPRYIIESIVE